MISVQYGASFAERLFPLVGAEGATALRLGFAAVILVAILRPWRVKLSRRTAAPLLGYGVSLALLNLMFYESLRLLPLGIAVALEFTGPLTLAVLASRRAADFAWIALAAAGLVRLAPIAGPGHPLTLLGVAFALGAGVCWAAYAVFGKRTGQALGASASALGAVIAAVIVAPIGLIHAGAGLFAVPVLLTALVVAVLSSALPYTLEMVALTRLSPQVYGTLTSAEPAIGAVMGFTFLHQTLTTLQAGGVTAIMMASIGTTLTLQRAPLPIE
jgi:inner membrane transporter RhtA